MSTLTLDRYCYSDTVTEGKLWLDDETYLCTLERPWKAGMPGGMPFESCVPDGTYELVDHVRPDGSHVFALRNPDLDVYYTAEERGERSGRYLILIHAANFVEQIAGCIAPGMSRTIHDNRPMVRSSREAMRALMSEPRTTILIRPTLGARQ